MSQFDESTESEAEEWRAVDIKRENSFTAGRNSVKESLEILARAVKHISIYEFAHNSRALARTTIIQVKARGDWPLEEKEENAR